jgi:hypothetical protein
MRNTISVAAALIALSVGGIARAQGADSFGGQGQFIVSADRLFGINFWSLKMQPDATPTNPNPGKVTESGTSINLLWGSGSSVAGEDLEVYSIPRLAFDYTVIPSLTLGGAIGYLHRSAKRETTANGVTTSEDRPTGDAFLINPRIGYAVSLSPTVAVWPRGGVTYFSASQKEPNGMGSVTLSGFAFSLDPQLVISPIPHFGFTLGLVADIPLSGTTKTETTVLGTKLSVEFPTKITNFGLAAGVLGYF